MNTPIWSNNVWHLNRSGKTATKTLSLTQARRLALRAQGFGSTSNSRAPGWRSMNSCINTMGALQIDAINTVIRSHYMPLYSRLGSYDRTHLNARLFDAKSQSAARRTHFEYWGHECSIMPIALYPLLQWRMQEARQGIGPYKQLQNIVKRKPGYVKKIRQRIEQGGAATCRELSDTKRGKGMWEWSETKQALEYLFWIGDITTAGRRGFERIYDIRERALPSHLVANNTHTREDAQATLLELSAKALGVATAADIRDYFRMPADASATGIQRLVEEKRLQEVQVESWEKTAYMLPTTIIPRTANAATLLTPFDPLVWHRDRTMRLFGFHYRIEIYVPEAKRQYGYYVLPFLLGDTLVARLDVKADRERGELIIKGAWAEANVDESDVAEHLVVELHRLKCWLELNTIKLINKGNLYNSLKLAMN